MGDRGFGARERRVSSFAFLLSAWSPGNSLPLRPNRRIPDLLIREETENERMSLIQAEEQRQSAIRMDNMVQYNENLIAERFEDVKQIEKDVMEINEIFRDLAVMVDDQGEKLGGSTPLFT